MHTQFVNYADGDVELEGYLACDDAQADARPAVLVAHTWAGRNDFACRKAEELAELGYVGFALDLYGKGVIGANPEENAALMQPFMDDRAMLRRRMETALHVVRELDMVDAHRVAAIGYCFGGLCVLDLARAGAPVQGVVSFHGLLQGADGLPNADVAAKILVLHGYDDPFAPPDLLDVFCREMTDAEADWQVHVYGGVVHAFTNPEVSDRASGVAYDADADRRSWEAMGMFLGEIL